MPCHLIIFRLGGDESLGILFFHAFSGCDCVSEFHGIGKKTAWNIFINIPNLFILFAELSITLDMISERQFKEIERYVILLYQKSSSKFSVNDARKQLFTQNRKIENIPPKHILLLNSTRKEQHTRQVIFGDNLSWLNQCSRHLSNGDGFLILNQVVIVYLHYLLDG